MAGEMDYLLEHTDGIIDYNHGYSATFYEDAYIFSNIM